MARPPLAHAHLEDRNRAPLRFRRELFESLFAYAVHLSVRRRKRMGVKPGPINHVAEREQIWCRPREGRAKVLERYGAHTLYLEGKKAPKGKAIPAPIAARTLTRHLAAMKRERVLKVINHSRWDKESHRWIQEPNLYVITWHGVLWIKRHARALQIPRFL